MRVLLATLPVLAVPHLFYHAATLHYYELAIDRLGNLLSLGFVVLLPLVLLFLDGLSGGRRRAVNREARGGLC